MCWQGELGGKLALHSAILSCHQVLGHPAGNQAVRSLLRTDLTPPSRTRGHSDVEAGLARHALLSGALPNGDGAQEAVVGVQHPPPRDSGCGARD